MCIAIAKPRGTFISERTLRNCWTANPDGAGFAFTNEDGEVEVYKYMNFKSFYEAYQVVDEFYGQTSDFLIHFRITSRGATRIDNCHPFQINNKMAFIHNGTITGMPLDTEHQHSDTYLFNELILKKLPENWEESEGIRYLIEDMIGWSKIAVLHADKGIVIYNEEKGVYDQGIWYSNTSFKDKVPYQSADNYKNYYSNYNSQFDGDYSDWDYEAETGIEYRARRIKEENERKAKLAAEATAKQLVLIGGTDTKAVVILDADKDKDKLKTDTKDEDTEQVTFIECQECGEWCDEEDMYIIEGEGCSIVFCCEGCLCTKEANCIEYTLVTLDQDAYVETVQKYIASGLHGIAN